MRIEGSVVLVTGANRGIGESFCRAFLERGATRVYAGARTPSTVAVPGAVPVSLDITNPASVSAAAACLGDVTILVNNAGILRAQPLLGAPSMEAAREQMEVNFFGTLAMCRAFAPILGGNGGGAIMTMLSVVSWISPPPNGSYAASKAAAWSLNNEIRVELHAQGTQVVGVHVGFVDTAMTSHVTAAKSTPGSVVAQACDGLEAGALEVLADERTRTVKASLSRDLELLYDDLYRTWSP